MPKEGTRRVAERLQTTLNAASGFLAAELTQQETDFGEAAGFLEQIPDRDQRAGDLAELTAPQNFPCLFVIPRGWDQGELFHGFKDVEHRIEVQIYAAHTIELTLQNKLWMYSRAVEKVLEDRHRTDEEIFDMEWETAIYSPITPWREPGTFIQGVALIGTFHERVTRPYQP